MWKRFIALCLGLSVSASAFAIAPSNTVDIPISIIPGSVVNGDILYGSNKLFQRLGVGTNGQVLTLVGGLPSWQNAGGGGGSASFDDTLFSLFNHADSTKLLQFQLSGITTGTTRTLTIPNVSDTLVTLGATQTLTNKTLTNPVESISDANFSLFSSGDATKIVNFNVTPLSSGVTRTMSFPNASGNVVLDNAGQTLTGKTITGSLNTIGIQDNRFTVFNNSDTTKIGAFDASNITTGTTRTYVLPNVNGTLLTTGTVVSPAQGGTGATGVPTNGQIPIGNGTVYVPATITAGTGITVTSGSGTVTIASTGGSLAPLAYNTVAPTWTDATHFAVAQFAVYDSTGATALQTTSNTNVTTTAGVANGIAQSANLAGTVANSSNTAVVGTGTAFTTDFIVGDTIYIGGADAQAYKITAIADNTHLTISRNGDNNVSGVAYNRGGLATDTAYYLYAISQAAGVSPSLLLSTRSISNGDTMVDLPSGYTLFRQLPFVQLTDDVSGSMTATKAGFFSFNVSEWGASSSHILWNVYAIPDDAAAITNPFINLANALSSTTFAGGDINTNAPKCVNAIDTTLSVVDTATHTDAHYYFANTTTGIAGGNGGTVIHIHGSLALNGYPAASVMLGLNSSRHVFFKSASTASLYMALYGYHVVGIK